MPTNNLSPKSKNYLSSIPPNMAERFGSAVSPYLQGVQELFPPTNPYGQALSNFLLGQAPQAAQRMAEGYPNVLFDTRNLLGGNRIVNPVALDMLGALPVATALKGAGLAKGGVAATFAGARAKTANHTALALAEKMKAAGVADEEIHKATGWFFGSADGKPRFEIPDDEAKLRASNFEKYNFSTSPNKSAMYEGTVAGGIKHDQLINAYPEVGDIKYAGSYEYGPSTMGRVEPSGLVTGRASGVYQPFINKINVNSGYAEDIAGAKNQTKSTTLHELQHAVQQREGFARGGSPEAMAREYGVARSRLHFLEQEPDYLEGSKQIDNLWNQAFNGGQMDEAAIAAKEAEIIQQYPSLAEARKVMDTLRQTDEYGFDSYKRLAGEAEARLTQSRMDMTGAERAASYPPGMYDVPVSDQIVRYGEGPALATTWHGSPHKFAPTELNDLGEFNAAKIGSGEGAQAYGHGHYMAEAQGVAKGYKDTLAYKAFDIGPESVARGIPLSAGARGEFIRQAQANVAPEVAAKNLQNANISARSLPREKLADLFAAYQKEGGGQLYKVDIPDEHIAQMLDWDKPLSEQSAGVQKALRENELWDVVPEGRPLGEMVQAMGRAMGPERTSNILRELGTPGVRYLDAGSRGAEGGTSNFVVFPGNEHMMTILERNGQAMSPESQAIARYREIKGPKSVVRMEAALRTAGVPLPKNEPVAYIQGLVDRAHRRN